MAANDEHDDRTKVDSSSDRSDPLEDQTQPMSARSRPERPEDPASLDTTTWGGSASPPVIVEEPVEEAADETQVVDSDDGSGSSGGTAEAADSMATVISSTPLQRPAKVPLAPSSSLSPMLLERIDPSLGRGERLRLDASHWMLSLGRAEDSDLRLYTASASRNHATIAGDEAGNWVLTPAAGKSVSIDGEAVSEPFVLEVGMNIVLGGDHLRCVSEGLDRDEMKAQTAADGFDDRGAGRAGSSGRSKLGWWLIGLCAAVGVGLILYAMFGG